MENEQAIVDYATGMLLRYFRGGSIIQSETPRLNQVRDADLLKSYWAISRPVRSLISYILAHPHEAQSLLTFRTRIDDAIARGRIDARKTRDYRRRTGLASAIISEEAVRSFDTGANQVLAWVINEAAALTARLSSWQSPSSPYGAFIEQAQSEIRAVQRIDALREPLRTVQLGKRPGHGAFQMAARSRNKIYRLALDAYLLFRGLERGDIEAMKTVAKTGLIAPLETWRKFELAVGLAVAEALSLVTGLEAQLHLLETNSSYPIATIGQFSIYWQQRTEHFNTPDLEPSEILVKDILKAYGLPSGADRPDLVIVDRNLSLVCSVIEVKYLAGDTASARFREGVEQIVRYSRGYAEPMKRPALIARSLIVLSKNAPQPSKARGLIPVSVDFDGLIQNELLGWAHQLV